MFDERKKGNKKRSKVRTLGREIRSGRLEIEWGHASVKAIKLGRRHPSPYRMIRVFYFLVSTTFVGAFAKSTTYHAEP